MKEANMILMGGNSAPKAYSQPVAPPTHYYIYSPVSEEIPDYVEMIHHLDCAMPGEEIHIHLATPGGSMETAIAIVHAIMRSNATVVGHADATVASAGTIIFLACSGWMVYNYSSFMFHDGSLGTPPMKFNESKKMIDHTMEMYSQICHEMYGIIMTDDEIENIINGHDVYMKYDEMKRRLEEYAEFIKSESEKEETETVCIDC
ncbi:MAG: ATP-dependent Clp protease proteolytic subunit [Nitrosopumilaceae archaeon]|nr:ATP-dependent Clp protease proteolytic subunit [Nitrosopumilaceae archaeon]